MENGKIHESLILRVLLGLSVLFLCGAVFLYFREYKSHQQSLARIASLEREKNELKQGRPALNLVASIPSPVGIPTRTERDQRADEQHKVEDRENQPAKQLAGDLTEEQHQWLVQGKLRDLERYVVLTDQQRRRLLEKFEKEYERIRLAPQEDQFPLGTFTDRLGEIAGVESMEDILGTEVVDEVRQARKENLERFKMEQIEEEVFSLSRKLALNTEQEQQTQAAITATENEMEKVTIDLFSKRAKEQNNSGGVGAEGTPTIFREILERRKVILNERLRAVLSDDQYNKLLEEQALSPDRFLLP